MQDYPVIVIRMALRLPMTAMILMLALQHLLMMPTVMMFSPAMIVMIMILSSWNNQMIWTVMVFSIPLI